MEPIPYNDVTPLNLAPDASMKDVAKASTEFQLEVMKFNSINAANNALVKALQSVADRVSRT